MLFFFVSGIIIEGGQKYSISFKDYLIKRLKSIVIPYLVFSILGGIAHILAQRTVSSVLEVGYYTLTLKGYSALWFLPAIFFGELIIYPILNAKHKHVLSIIVVIVGVALMIGYNYLQLYFKSQFENTTYKLITAPFLTLSHVITGTTLLLIGAYVYNIILKHVDERNVIALIIAFVVLIGCSVITYFNPGVGLDQGLLGDIPPLYFVTGIGMCISILLITRFLCSFTYKFPVLTWCGKSSLIIMCTHNACYITNVVVKLAGMVIVAPIAESFQFYLYYAVLLIIVMAIEFVVVTIINKFFPWMTGRFKKRGKSNE